MLQIRIKRDTEYLEPPVQFHQSPQGLIELAKAMPWLRDEAKRKYGISVEVFADANGSKRIHQEDLDYVLHVEFQERSTQRTRRPDQRRVQRGQGPLKRAAEVLAGLEG